MIATIALSTAGPAGAQTLYYYPQQGQSTDQLNADKGQCTGWAVGQTGFDPANPPPPPQPNLPQQQAQGPDGSMVRGAARGAAAGAVAGEIFDDKAGKGAAAGAATGALLGGMNRRSARRQQAQAQQQAQSQYQQQQAQYQSQLAAKRSEFNRAMTACMSGRGYTVS